MNVVILTTAKLERLGDCEGSVHRWAVAGDEVRLVTMHPLAVDGWELAGVTVLGAPTSGAGLGRMGRALVRVWPGSPGRQLRRRLVRSDAARSVLEAADLVVGVETACGPALWWSSRRHPDVPHISGLASGLQLSKR